VPPNFIIFIHTPFRPGGEFRKDFLRVQR